MRFPSAFSGVKKIFTAEILRLIASVIGVITYVLLLVAISAKTADGAFTSGGASLILGIVTMIIGLVAFIINLVGIIQAMKDEGSFKVALIFVIIDVIAGILQGIFTSNQTVTSIFNVVQTLSTLLVMIFIIRGIQNLAVRLGNENVLNNGKTILTLIIVVQILALIAAIIATIFKASDAANYTAGILMIVSAAIEVVTTIMYLVFLGKAKNMLAEGK